MPYEKHPIYLTPPDDTVIWRYMDFARFVQLLDFRELWFARADTLKTHSKEPTRMPHSERSERSSRFSSLGRPPPTTVESDLPSICRSCCSTWPLAIMGTAHTKRTKPQLRQLRLPPFSNSSSKTQPNAGSRMRRFANRYPCHYVARSVIEENLGEIVKKYWTRDC
jgi:hypothetical protein